MNRLTEVVHIRVTKTLKYEIATMANFYGVDQSDFVRLALYQAVEHYYMKPELKAELLKEIGLLRFRDSIQLLEGTKEDDLQELDEKDATKYWSHDIPDADEPTEE